jgi:hypothetical protein
LVVGIWVRRCSRFLSVKELLNLYQSTFRLRRNSIFCFSIQHGDFVMEPVKYMQERIAFKELLLKNPNYFGTFPHPDFKPVLNINGLAAFEQISCVGFNPDLDILEATILIHRPDGYLGDLCHAGSQEYVRFFVDFGSGWQDVGMSAFNAHDIATAHDCAKDPTKPLSYVVTHALDPQRDYCGRPMLPKVRAILSWQAAPPAGQPDWQQVWGNTVDVHIQIKPRKWFVHDILDSVGALKKIPEALQLAKFESVNIPLPPEPTVKALSEIYAENPKADAKANQTVEPKRFAMKFAHSVKSALEFNDSIVPAAVEELKLAGIDWGNLLGALDETQGDVSYEELQCLGLDYNREWLVASLTMKKASGFSGGPCTAGSTEYVAFWADWDDKCEWTYLGTSSVNVHDYAGIPSDGLHYWVGLPAKLDEHRRSCNEPKIGRIRAVLSWNSPPSTTDPDAVPHWGNRLDSHVEVKPVGASLGNGLINIIGGVRVESIDVAGSGGGLTKAGAKFALDGGPVDGYSRECPFGGRIHIQGFAPDSFYLSGRKYRLLRHKKGSANLPVPVTNPFYVSGVAGPGQTITPDPVSGYVSYLPSSQNLYNMLGWWETGGIADEQWEVLLEWIDGASNSGFTPWHTIQVNNTSPEASIEIANGLDCKDFAKGQPVEGIFVARHKYFGSWSLHTAPSSFGPPRPTPSDGITEANGDRWTLVTAAMKPCGYVVAVHVHDRTIVGSIAASHNSTYDDTGFCLREHVM